MNLLNKVQEAFQWQALPIRQQDMKNIQLI